MQNEEIKKYLAKLGLPTGDNYELPTSHKTFPDGAHFRTEELPMTVADYEKTFAVYDKAGYVVNKVTDTRGIMFDTDEEIVRKCELCREHGCELILGPGAAENPYDISQQVEAGKLVSGKVRGMDQLFLAVRSMLRAAELGCRGFIIYDEGLLDIAIKMRKEGKLPPKTKFKVSSNISVSNAAGIKFWASLLGPGDGINPIRDLTLPMIAAMRQVTDNALDIHVLWHTSIARIMDAPEIVRVGAPLYLKNAWWGKKRETEERCLQGIRVVQMINKYYPEAKQSKPGAPDMCIPAQANG